MGEIVEFGNEPVLTCPQCDGQEFFIHMEEITGAITKDDIVKIECSECDYKVDLGKEVIAKFEKE